MKKWLLTIFFVHSNSNYSNYLFQILKLHMVLFKLEIIQANYKLFFTENKIIEINLTLLNYLKYYLISIKDFVRIKKICNRKKERATKAIFLMKLNTNPLKFKCRLADGRGGGAGWSTHARHWYPHLVNYKMLKIRKEA